MDDVPGLSASAGADQENELELLPEPLSDVCFFVIIGSVVLAEAVAIVAWLTW
jgi:hypothetical protein